MIFHFGSFLFRLTKPYWWRTSIGTENSTFARPIFEQETCVHYRSSLSKLREVWRWQLSPTNPVFHFDFLLFCSFWWRIKLQWLRMRNHWNSLSIKSEVACVGLLLPRRRWIYWSGKYSGINSACAFWMKGCCYVFSASDAVLLLYAKLRPWPVLLTHFFP